MSRVAAIAIALTLDALAGLAGGLLKESWLHRLLGPMVGFAAGALLSVAMLDLLPEAAQQLGTTGFALALGALVATALLEWAVGHPAAHGELSGPLPASLLGSDALHNLGDGAAIAAAFLASTKAGSLAAAAVILHEVPQEVGDYALLRASGMRRGKALLGLMLVQLTAFIGAALVLVAVHATSAVTSIALALAAGTFLFIGGTDLLPELNHGERSERRRRRVGFLVGLLGVAAATLLLE